MRYLAVADKGAAVQVRKLLHTNMTLNIFLKHRYWTSIIIVHAHCYP